MTGSLLRTHPAFRSLWTANVASQFGVRVGGLAVPLVAIETLHASPFAVGALNAVQYVGLLLIGLPVGVWVDRTRRKPILFAADAARAVLFAGIATLGWLGWLSYPHLLVVVLLGGFATVFFDVAHLSLLPGLVAPEELLEANARIQSAQSVALIAGPALGGALVSAIGTSGAVWVTAAGFALSGLQILRIRAVEAPAGRPPGSSLVRQMGDGLRLVFGHPVLRAIALCTAWTNLFQAMFISLNLLLLTRIVGLSGAVVGLLIACSGVGAVLGALAGHRVARRLGRARTAWLVPLLTQPLTLLVPLTGQGWRCALFAVGMGAVSFGGTIYNIAQVTLRQSMCPPELLGRMNASNRVVVFSTLPVGSFAAGAVAGSIGVRATLWIAAVGVSLSSGWLLASPLRHSRDEPPVSVPG
ncbi:MAG: MFS transporter [Actinobacteria bacterium]|nr:MFS transporter [Actinomycetota bacterium]